MAKEQKVILKTVTAKEAGYVCLVTYSLWPDSPHHCSFKSVVSKDGHVLHVESGNIQSNTPIKPSKQQAASTLKQFLYMTSKKDAI